MGPSLFLCAVEGSDARIPYVQGGQYEILREIWMNLILKERDDPLAQLHALLTDVSAGNGASVLVTGEAGAGKTTFFQAFEQGLPDDIRIYRGSCEDLSIPEPLGPVLELARSAGWDLDLERLKDGQRLDAFARVLDLAHDPDQSTILMIEDLHWADEASLDFVRYLARRIAPFKIMLLINSRDIDAKAQQQLRTAFNGVSTEKLTRIPLQSLSKGAVIDLAQQAGANGAEIYQKTAGNAFFVAELLRNRDGVMPSSVQDAVLARVDHLCPEAKEVLQTISIFPRRAELDIVFSLAGGEDYQAIEDCIAAGLLDANGNYLSFRHEIARLAVENGLSAFKKRMLNTGLFALLEATETTPKARLMHHAQAGGLTEKMRTLAPEAAREAESTGALMQSAEYYEIALKFRDELTEPDRADLLESAAQIIGSNSNQRMAITLLNEAFAIRESLGQTLASVETLRILVRFYWEAGALKEAREFGDRAIALAGGSDGIELAWACAARTHVAMVDYQFPLARKVGNRAIELAERFGFKEVLAHTLSSVGMCSWDDQEYALSCFNRAHTLTIEGGFLSNSTRSFSNKAVYLHEHCRYHEALGIFEAGITYCQQHDIASGIALLSSWRLELRERMGAWDEVCQIGPEIWENGVQHFSGRFYVVLSLARIALRRGQPDAEEKYHQLREMLKNSEDARHTAHLAVLAAERAYLGLEDPEVAFALMAQAQWNNIFQLHMEQFARWQKRLGMHPELEEAHIFNVPYRLGLAGDWQGEAAAWAEIGCPYYEALALADGDAVANTRALEILSGLGAKVVEDVVRNRMRKAGITVKPSGPRASTKANPAGLTKRQLDVLRLLNDGLSNAEIGEKLFVSAKTVDHHVSAILGKLEVSTRGEAAALAREAGWV